MRQIDRNAVKQLLSEAGRLDLKKHVSNVWEDLPEEEQTHENCFEMLLVLFPEKKICSINIIEDEWGEAEY
jgi:hypothetical protein